MTEINRDTVTQIAKLNAAELTLTSHALADGNAGLSIGQLVLALAITAKACDESYERVAHGLRLAFKAVDVSVAKREPLQ